MIYSINNLLNSGSKAMNVDGSSSSKTFSYSPGSGSANILGITCLLRNEGVTALTKFGAITALTNGLLLQITQAGSTRSIATIKDNGDLCTTFHFNQFGSGAVLSIISVVTPEGFGNSNNVFVGYLEFPEGYPMVLSGSDSISAVVQDNLTSVDLLQMRIKASID